MRATPNEATKVVDAETLPVALKVTPIRMRSFLYVTPGWLDLMASMRPSTTCENLPGHRDGVEGEVDRADSKLQHGHTEMASPPSFAMPAPFPILLFFDPAQGTHVDIGLTHH